MYELIASNIHFTAVILEHFERYSLLVQYKSPLLCARGSVVMFSQ